MQSIEDIVGVFPKNRVELEARAEAIINQAQQELEGIYRIEPQKRTFDNTMAALDTSAMQFHVVHSVIHVLSLVSPDEEIRKAAQEAMVKLQSFGIDQFSLNKNLYEACGQYETLLKNPEHHEDLDAVQKYFIKETMHDFYRGGLQLTDEIQEKIRAVRKELSTHEIQFDLNIAADQRTIEVTKEELAGCGDSFINSLKKTSEGKYILKADGPTYNKIFEECDVASTRKAYYVLYMQRGYPANEKELGMIVSLRDELAHLLGYASYAQYDIDNQMAKTPETVRSFIDDVAARARIKVQQESELLKKDLPAGVSLTADGKFYPWDQSYVKNYYKKKYLAIDEAYISEFFPVEHTLPALLNIYEQFFSIHFKKVEATPIWHEDTEFLAVYKNGTYIGMAILDIHPRPFKYSHAAEATMVPAVRTRDGQWFPALLMVVANFPAAKPDQPALLKRQDVITFFHEFGHAIHALLGATELASFSGTNVKGDFMEMPSQMLEEWMWDPEILKKVSSHYKTKEPLPDDLIEKIRAMKNFDSGDLTMRQLSFASASLDYFLPGAHKDLFAIWKKNYEQYRSDLYFDPSNKGYCAFVHLTNYGAKYYGYMWSKVYAIDLFYYIKPYGLLNPTIGDRYTREVIGKGGSQDPMELLKNFLGREPNSQAFFKDLGL